MREGSADSGPDCGAGPAGRTIRPGRTIDRANQTQVDRANRIAGRQKRWTARTRKRLYFGMLFVKGGSRVVWVVMASFSFASVEEK